MVKSRYLKIIWLIIKPAHVCEIKTIYYSNHSKTKSSYTLEFHDVEFVLFSNENGFTRASEAISLKKKN